MYTRRVLCVAALTIQRKLLLFTKSKELFAIINKLLLNENNGYSVHIVKNHECLTRNLDEFMNCAIISNDNDIYMYHEDTINYLGSKDVSQYSDTNNDLKK